MRVDFLNPAENSSFTPECYLYEIEGISGFFSDLKRQNDHILESSRGHFASLEMEKKKNSGKLVEVALRGFRGVRACSHTFF